MIGTAMMAALVTLGLTRLRDDYLAIVTLGFAEAVRIVAENEIWLTKGTDGISGIPQPLKSTLGSDFNAVYLAFCLVILAIVLFVLERVRASPFGRVLRAIREDAQVAAFAGKDVLKFKVKAFAIGGALAGLAGALYAHYSSYIVPEIYVPLLTIYIFLALTAGGIGNNWGAVIGAFVVVFFLESTRFLVGVVPWLSAEQLAALREFLVGLGAAAGAVLPPARPDAGAAAAARRALSFLRPLDRLRDHPRRLRGIAPAEHLHPFAGLQILVVLEEVPHLLQGDLGQVGVVHHMRVALGELRHRHREHLLVAAGLVLHLEHADRAHVDHRARHDRPRVRDQHVDRIAVVGERVRHEAVIARIAHRRVQEAVDHQGAGGLVHLVLDRLAADRHLDDDVDVLGRIVADLDGVDAHEKPALLKPNLPCKQFS